MGEWVANETRDECNQKMHDKWEWKQKSSK